MSDELKTPWQSATFGMVVISTGEVVDLGGLYGDTLKKVVHRVNCHDKLVEALEDCIAELEASQGGHVKSVVAAKAALELAKGGTHD